MVKTHISVTRYRKGSHDSITAEFHSSHPQLLKQDGTGNLSTGSQAQASPRLALGAPLSLSVSQAGIVDEVKIDIFAFFLLVHFRQEPQ